jgi:hypothetical protein
MSFTCSAKITFPEDISYLDVTARWSDYKAPESGLVVAVASESDIEQTMKIFIAVTDMRL